MERLQRALQVVWAYHHMRQPLQKSNLILALGNHDFNTIYHAVRLFKEGWAPLLVLTGGLGNVTKDIWHESEAQQFYKIAVAEGVPSDQIVLEDKSTNTGENYAFTKQILDEKNLPYQRAIIVTKPYMERRAYATAKVHWPQTDIVVSSVDLSLETYLAQMNDREREINIMVGDLQRIAVYP